MKVDITSIFFSVTDSAEGTYEDGLDTILQDMQASKTHHHQWSYGDSLPHSYQRDRKILHMQEDGLHSQQQRQQRDSDRIAKFQWGRVRLPRIRIPRPRIRLPRPRIRLPRLRIRLPRIPRIIPRLPKLPRVSLPRIRVPRIRLNPKTFINKLKGIQGTIVGKLNPLKHLKLRGLGNIANSVVRKALSAVGRVGNKLRDGITRGVGGQIRGIAAKIGRGVSGATRGIFRNLGSISGRIANGFKQNILKYAKVLNDNVFKRVHNLMQGILRRVKDIGKKVAEKARQINGGLLSGIKGIGDKVWQSLRNVQNHVGARMKATVHKVTSAMKTFGATMWKKLKGFTGNMWKGIKRASTKALEVFKKMHGAAKGVGTKVFNAAKKFGKMIWSKLKGFAKKLWSGMKKAGAGVLKVILGSGKFLIKFAKSPLGQQILRSGLQGALNALGVPPEASGPILNGAMSMMNGQPMDNGGAAYEGGQGEGYGSMQPQYGGAPAQTAPQNYNAMQGQNSQMYAGGQTMPQYTQGGIQVGGGQVAQKNQAAEQLDHRGVASSYDVGHQQQEMYTYGGTNVGG